MPARCLLTSESIVSGCLRENEIGRANSLWYIANTECGNLQNKKSFVFCLIGGILLIVAGAVGSIGALELLTLIGTIPELEFLVPYIDLLLKALAFIAGLGGIGVIAGGFLLTTPRVGTGKFVIGIAAGMGLIGLIIQLVKVVYFAGFEGLINLLEAIAQSIGWIGIILTIIGRRTASTSE